MLTLAGCGPKSTPLPVAPERADPCRLSADSAAQPETLTVALTDSVDLAHAPNPTNDSERFLFRQLFETLVRVDCQGAMRPGLAAVWTQDSTGRTWTFTLRDGARFPDGSPVSAPRVISSWQARPDGVKALGIDSAVARKDGRLTVTVGQVRDSVPRLFAEPALAVTYAVEPTSRSSTRIITRGTGKLRALVFQVAPTADPRDALDRGADLVVTRDPALVDYAASRPEFGTFPLPWSRTYVLLQPAGAEPIDGVFDVDSVRRSLARDAVPADARPAEPPFWWKSPLVCMTDLSMEVTLPTSPRIVYPRGDEVARRLAERIVALASGGVQLRTAALEAQQFATAAFGGGRDRGYVVSLPRRVFEPCHESVTLPTGAWIQPLIDTRARAIVRRGSPPLTVDWDGIVRVEGQEAERKDQP